MIWLYKGVTISDPKSHLSKDYVQIVNKQEMKYILYYFVSNLKM